MPLTENACGMQIGHVSEAEQAFSKGLSLSQPQAPPVHLMRVLAQMRQGLGDHWQAIQVLTKALEIEPNMEQVQCYFLRGTRRIVGRRVGFQGHKCF